MKIVLPPPLADVPPPQPWFSDFWLLLRNQMRVTLNTFRQRPGRTLAGIMGIFTLTLFLLFSLGSFAYGALSAISPQTIQGFLSLLFMAGLSGQIFFGVTSAFVTLYMAEDLELLFMTPAPIKVVFAVKSLSFFASNLLIAFIFMFLPGIICGLLFQAGAMFYVLAVLVSLGFCLLGTAAAELINLLVMRIVPPHRSKEAVGFIGALTGILIALIFQLPGLLINNKENLNLNSWLASQENFLHVMDYFPWGWGSFSLINGLAGNYAAAIFWSLLLVLSGGLAFGLAFVLVERGFRGGFISLSQGEGGRRRKERTASAGACHETTGKNQASFFQESVAYHGSAWQGTWAVAKKDLLTLKRDTREWFAFLVPLILMAFFIGQYIMAPSASSRSSLIAVLIMYTNMFSGNMALRAFGREGESDWLLNIVPLAGWPVVWGKLISSVLPTLVLMEALLVGTPWLWAFPR
jgi:ABC-2 type transport system permease protein